MNKQEIIQIISSYLTSFEEVTILALNGSMADPNVSQDKFQDIDLSVLSSNTTKTIKIIKKFYLFNDIILYTEEHQKTPFSHTLIRILLNSGIEVGFSIYNDPEIFQKKINRFNVLLFNRLNERVDFSPPTHRPFHVNKPQKDEFNKLLVDIYWGISDVMKGVQREQFIYTKHKYDTKLQPKIKQLLTWYIRDLNDWNISLGSHGKRIKDHVESGIYNQYLYTYSPNTLKNIPIILVNVQNFVTDIGNRLAQSLGYPFPTDTDNKLSQYFNFK